MPGDPTHPRVNRTRAAKRAVSRQQRGPHYSGDCPALYVCATKKRPSPTRLPRHFLVTGRPPHTNPRTFSLIHSIEIRYRRLLKSSPCQRPHTFCIDLPPIHSNEVCYRRPLNLSPYRNVPIYCVLTFPPAHFEEVSYQRPLTPSPYIPPHTLCTAHTFFKGDFPVVGPRFRILEMGADPPTTAKFPIEKCT